MPIALIIFGVLAIVIALSGNYVNVITQLDKDLTGAGNFFVWIAAILALAVIGKVLHIPQTAKLFIVLILAVYLISNAGVFSQFQAAFASAAPPAPVAPNVANANNTAPFAPAATPAPAPNLQGSHQ